MKDKLARIASGIAALALIAGAAACARDGTDGDAAGCDVKLGFLGALTGDNAGNAEPVWLGASLAVSQYEGPCRVTIEALDSQGDPSKAAPLAQQAVDDSKIIGIIGPVYSGETEATGRIFADATLPTLSPSATRPSLTDKGWATFHRGVGNDLSQGPAASRYIASVLKAERVFLIKDDSAFGIGVSTEVKDAIPARLVVGEGELKTGDTTFPDLVNQVVDSRADALFFGGYYPEGAPLLSQLRDADWSGTFVGADGINNSGFLEALSEQKAEGAIATCASAPATKAAPEFVSAFKAANDGVPPGNYADVAYDLTNIFLEGISAGHTTRADLQSFITSYEKAGSATGVTYKWTAKGELEPSQVRVWMFRVVHGAWVPEGEAPRG